MKNLKSYEEFIIESTPTVAFDGQGLELGKSVMTFDGFSGIIVAKEISNGRIIFRDHTGVLHVCESQYMITTEELNEGLQWWEITKGILAADIIKAGSALVGGGLVLGGMMFSSWRKSIANKAESMRKDAKIKEAAMKIADRFNNDSELNSMIKTLEQYPYIKLTLMPNKTEKKRVEKNNAERSKILKEIAKHIKDNLSAEEMEYFETVNKMLKDKPLTDNGGAKVEEDLQQLADGVKDPSSNNSESQLNRDPQRTIGTGTYTSTWSDPLPFTKAGWYTKDAASAGTIPTYVQ